MRKKLDDFPWADEKYIIQARVKAARDKASSKSTPLGRYVSEAQNKAIPSRADSIIYKTLTGVLKGFDEIYKGNPVKAKEEGIKAVRELTANLREKTRKEIDRNIIKPYEDSAVQEPEHLIIGVIPTQTVEVYEKRKN